MTVDELIVEASCILSPAARPAFARDSLVREWAVDSLRVQPTTMSNAALSAYLSDLVARFWLRHVSQLAQSLETKTKPDPDKSDISADTVLGLNHLVKPHKATELAEEIRNLLWQAGGDLVRVVLDGQTIGYLAAPPSPPKETK